MLNCVEKKINLLREKVKLLREKLTFRQHASYIYIYIYRTDVPLLPRVCFLYI